ncbi:MAG: TonB-dependent receptor [Candidatus Kapaibacterium sp.]
MKLIIIAMSLIMCGQLLYANAIKGRIADAESNRGLAGAVIRVDGSDAGTVARNDGSFELDVPPGDLTLIISYIGYKKEKFSINTAGDEEKLFLLKPEPVRLREGVTVLGSGTKISRSNIESSVPVDIISSKELEASGKVNAADALTELVPSFNSRSQTFADGTDHIDPASLRGLGPDQALVLINGKRRHTTALVNVTPIIGRGSVGTDLNAIPVTAIQRIEILRDGASAQYGSDAIAGVINIILKEQTDEVYFNTYAGQTTQADGETISLGSNFGTAIGEGGFINLTAELRDRGHTNRARAYTGMFYRTADQDGLSEDENRRIDDSIMSARAKTPSDFNLRIGQSEQLNGGIFLNTEIPVNDSTDFYAFGGINYRDSRSAGFYRFPNDRRNNQEIYPDGFLPFINGRIMDRSLAAGVRNTRNGWNFDLSNVYGGNSYKYDVDNSLNRSWGSSSPTSFYSGTLLFDQNTSNLDISKAFADAAGLTMISFGAGAEFRYESFTIEEGELASYSYKDSTYEPGAQVFPGFRPENAGTHSRTSGALYAGVEADITNSFLISIAGRYESYSDFGNSLNGKLSARYMFGDFLNLRGAASTGFRAPSLHQQYFSSTTTVFYAAGEDLIPLEVLTAPNDSRIAQAFGIGELEEETSVNISFGLASKLTESTMLTVDAYKIDINDRIVLSGYFSAFDPSIAGMLEGLPGVDAVQFFSNAINTETLGIEAVITQRLNIWDDELDITASINYAQTEVVGDIQVPENFPDDEDLKSTLFSREEIARLERGLPLTKANLTLNYTTGNLGIMLRNVYYGEVGSRTADIENAALLDQDYSGKVLTDAEISYRISDGLKVAAGGNNIFDVYPDENVPAKQDGGRFPYNTAVTQFGFNGAFYYGRLEISL